MGDKLFFFFFFLAVTLVLLLSKNLNKPMGFSEETDAGRAKNTFWAFLCQGIDRRGKPRAPPR
jgi:hypothetical protein